MAAAGNGLWDLLAPRVAHSVYFEQVGRALGCLRLVWVWRRSTCRITRARPAAPLAGSLPNLRVPHSLQGVPFNRATHLWAGGGRVAVGALGLALSGNDVPRVCAARQQRRLAGRAICHTRARLSRQRCPPTRRPAPLRCSLP